MEKKKSKLLPCNSDTIPCSLSPTPLEQKGPEGLRSASSPSLVFSDPSSMPIAPGLGFLKLLKHLRMRVRQLHSESWAHTSTPVQLATAAELAGSYLETVCSDYSRRCPSYSQL